MQELRCCKRSNVCMKSIGLSVGQLHTHVNYDKLTWIFNIGEVCVWRECLSAIEVGINLARSVFHFYHSSILLHWRDVPRDHEKYFMFISLLNQDENLQVCSKFCSLPRFRDPLSGYEVFNLSCVRNNVRPTISN